MKPIRSYPAWVYSLPVVLLFAWYSSGALAHTKLSSSVPEAGTVIQHAPEELVLSYGDPVNLVKLTLNDGKEEAVGINFKPAAKPATTFKLPLPTLDAGQYTAKWTALGADGHMLQGSFSFTLQAGSH